ncbi:M50 family metallopeptidase [Gordonia sp. CPCC 206044]|uniref:M50 family metallopeptidase n=1 Tax=Gordonia sp. CPCC 206044 TaxID=3140793 RepID=UPI003AF3D6FF
MSFALGVLLFAAALLLSVAWHECGHMWAAQATGMKVRRYFVGFGPTAWSTRRGETEYGVKWLPLGGFCDIAGMTPYEELTADERSRAMYKQAAWKRLVVLFAGPAQNFILGFVLVLILAVGWGLPSLDGTAKVYVDRMMCVAPTTDAQGKPVECTGEGPAQQAGLAPGDQVVAINGHQVRNSEDLVLATWEIKGTADVEVIRDGQTRTFAVPVTQVQRMKKESDGSLSPVTVGAIGIGLSQDGITHYDNVFTAIPGAIGFTGDLFKATWDALLSLPSKVSDLWTAVTGGERAADTPVSVYGASVMGGQAAERGAWSMFLALLISINFFLGLFNLVPLLPLDGGHMAIVAYEKGRNALRRLFGRQAGGPVDYLKLMPITYAVVIVMGGFMVLTLTADIVNPIQIF